jgi:hypothetical protein
MASSDSIALGFGARMRPANDRTMEFRLARMHDSVRQQHQVVERGRGAPQAAMGALS